jgi:hypothetical protein
MQELTGAMCEQFQSTKSHPPDQPRGAAPPIEIGGCYGKRAGAHW